MGIIAKCKKACMTCINTINRGFNYILSIIGFCLLIWALYAYAVNDFLFTMPIKGMLIAGSMQFLFCFYFGWKGHKITWFIKCYYVVLVILIIINIAIIILCLDKNLRDNVVKDTLTKINGEKASETIISDNYILSGYIMVSITVLEIISLLLSMCRRKDLINRRKYNELDEDDVHSYYVEMGGDSFDATNGNSLNRKLIVSEREEHGWLHKKGNDAFNAQWKKRWFVMEDDALTYYETPESRKAQGSIELTGLRCMRAEPEKRKIKTHPWTFKIYNPENSLARVYYLYASTSKKERTWLEWIMNGIERANKLNASYDHLVLNNKPNENNEGKEDEKNFKTVITPRKEKKQGWLHKKGQEKFNAQWKKRWFVVQGGYVDYYTKPESDKPNGSIKLKGCFVSRAEEAKRKKSHPYTFKVFNPNVDNSRVYYLYADSANAESLWIKWIRSGINYANGNADDSNADDKKTDDEEILINFDQYNNDDTNALENPFGEDDDMQSNDKVVVDDNNANDDTTELLDTTDEVDNRKHKSRSTLSNFTMYK